MTRPVVLTLNAGSSSLKFGLYDIADGGTEPHLLAVGLVDSIGGNPKLKVTLSASKPAVSRDLAPSEASNHEVALATSLKVLRSEYPDVQTTAVGHRVVHGGPHFQQPVVVDEKVMADLQALSPFAPLHQPHNLSGIVAAQHTFPDALQVACFDTAFHRTQPKVNESFALPREWYDKGVRRYGFHGLSYDYISGELKEVAPLLHAGRVVVAHLGNGASMCAIKDGKAIATTMAFTPLDGLSMGTRCGQIDPGVTFYLVQQAGLTIEQVSDMYYKKSGLLGMSGLSNDMRTLEAAGTPEAQEAIEYFVYRARCEIASLAAALGGIDALVFCGGIGENSRSIRRLICEGMSWMGLEIDHVQNDANARVISTEFSRARIMVIPTNEELVIARACKRLLAE